LSSIASGDWRFSHLFIAFLLALSMIVPFRLADDLADRKHDQLHYADRELCTTQYLRSYKFALGLLACIAVIAVFFARGRIAMILLLAAFLYAACWYNVREALRASAICNYHLVLAKYAAFALILIDPGSWCIPIEAWWSSATAYVLLLLWEVAHDATYRKSVTAKRLAVIEFFSWLVWTLWIVL
jgi:hypothetical protein